MVDWSTVAFVFPGQGSQVVGMGADFAQQYPIVAETYQEADDILGFSLSSLCFDGPESDLNDTINTQPALFVTSIAILRVLQTELPDAVPAFVAGHSLGELSALTASGALDFRDGVQLVRARGRLMKKAGEQQPGAMAAILGLNADVVWQICAEASETVGKPLVLANDNCPGQLVISGDNDALDLGLSKASESGARRAVKLAVSIAAHSPLMVSVSERFNEAVKATDFTTPTIPIYANITAAPITTVEAIQEELTNQLTQSVRWTESVQGMIANGVSTFIEIGSKEVLTGLARRIDRSTTRISLSTTSSFDAFLEQSRQ